MQVFASQFLGVCKFTPIPEFETKLVIAHCFWRRPLILKLQCFGGVKLRRRRIGAGRKHVKYLIIAETQSDAMEHPRDAIVFAFDQLRGSRPSAARSGYLHIAHRKLVGDVFNLLLLSAGKYFTTIIVIVIG